MSKKNSVSLPHLASDAAYLVEDLQEESDRGAALLGAAFLDDVLDVLLRSALVADADAVNKLVGPGRPLESFGARAHLAYCMGLLGCDVYQDINLIREIRNDFAHRQPASFEWPQISAKCQRLKCLSVMMHDSDCPPRDRYIVTVVLIANHLMVAAESQKHATSVPDFSRNGVLRLR